MVTAEENALIERLIDAGTPALAIRAAVPSVSRTNIYLKIQKYKKHGTVGRVQTKTLGRPRAMDKTLEGFLQGLLVAKPNIELDEMRTLMKDRMGVTVSLSTISRAVTRAGISKGRLCRVKNPTRSRKPKVKGDGGADGDAASASASTGGTGVENPDEETVANTLDVETTHAPQHDDQSPQQLHLSTWDHMSAHHLPTHVNTHPLPQQQQHDMMHIPHHLSPHHQHDNNTMHPHDNAMQHAHDNTMHALDPSLSASPFLQATAVAYHANIYADLSRVAPHAAIGMNAVSGSNIDYRSPYAPL